MILNDLFSNDVSQLFYDSLMKVVNEEKYSVSIN